MAGFEGVIDCRLVIGNGRVSRVSTTSTRPVGFSQSLAGRPVAEVVTLIPSLFSVCGAAQRHAALVACEGALKIVPSQSQRKARAMVLDAEMGREHAWQIMVDWPRVVGDTPDMVMVAGVRKTFDQIKTALYGEGEIAKLGGGTITRAGQRIDEAVTRIVEALSDQIFAVPLEDWAMMSSLAELTAWARQCPTPAGRLITKLLSGGLAGFGACDVGLMPSMRGSDLDDVLRADTKNTFIAHPLWDGQALETGPLARNHGHPLVGAVVDAFGLGLLARFVARLVELAQVPERLVMVAGGVRDETPADVGGDGSGAGIAVVRAARGTLVHRVEVDRGRISRYQILAPTEWNFHPQGPLARGLLDADGETAVQMAQLLMTALDPCVECTVTVEQG